MKLLLICRHAKSSWKDPSLADMERPLNKRGKRDAPVMGRRLADRNVQPDLIVSSPARRAMATAGQLAKQLGYPKKNIVVSDAMYAASPDVLLELVRDMDDNLQTICMVGHNPETTILANNLGKLNISNVPTCGIIALEFAVDSWKEAGSRKGRLLFYDYPKNEAAR